MQHKIALFKPYHSEAMESAALEVLRSGQIASGAKVQQFQLELGRLLGNPHVVTTSDMSSAMQIALRLAGVGPQDEVLTSAYTCMSSNAPIATTGALPRWVDVHPDTGLMDPASLARAITSRTKACILYHAAGYPAQAEAIARICSDRNVVLIEDCNNAFGAQIDGRPVGSFGDMAIYSFYPNRQINASEGGAIALRDAEQANRAIRLRRFGIDLSSFRDALGEIDPQSDIPEIGWSAGMNNLCSALGLAQLDGFAERLARTQANARWLTSHLADLPGVQVITPGAGCEPAYWGLMTLVEQRDLVLRHLKEHGVMAGKLHERTDGYSGFGTRHEELPGTTTFMQRVIAFPCGWWLDEADLERIRTTMVSAVDSAAAAVQATSA